LSTISPPTRIAQLEKGSLKKVLGIFDLAAIGYGDLGSSIYYALGITALFALGATPIALLLAGLVFVCTALTYAEMTSMFQESGGSASFSRHAFNDLISFVAGWGLLLDYIVTIAISIFAAGPYLAVFFHGLHRTDMQIGFSIGLIAILLLINILGIRQSSRMSLLLVGCTLLTQLLIIAIGFGWSIDFTHLFEHMSINRPDQNPWSPSWPDFWKGTSMAMVAYTGIESIAQLGAEAKRPAKTVPRAVLLTMCILLFMYLGISIVALSSVSPQALGTTYMLDPLAGIVASLPFGTSFLSPWIGLLAAALLFVAGNAGLVGASRLSYNMGEYYQLPRFFYQIHDRFRTPVLALTVFAILAMATILLSRGRLSFLADLYNFGAQLAFFFAHLSLISLRLRHPEASRPFKIPWNIHVRGAPIPITAVIGCLATIAVWFLIVITKPEGRYLGFAWVSFGIAMYFFYRKKKKMVATGKLAIDKIKMPHYKRMEISKILSIAGGESQTDIIQLACQLASLHNAKLTTAAMIEVPPSLPLDFHLPHRFASAQSMLKKAEAIGREYSVDIDLRTIRTRAIPDAVSELIQEEQYDLIILGSLKRNPESKHKDASHLAEKISRQGLCRVMTLNTLTYTKSEK